MHPQHVRHRVVLALLALAGLGSTEAGCGTNITFAHHFTIVASTCFPSSSPSTRMFSTIGTRGHFGSLMMSTLPAMRVCRRHWAPLRGRGSRCLHTMPRVDRSRTEVASTNSLKLAWCRLIAMRSTTSFLSLLRRRARPWQQRVPYSDNSTPARQTPKH